MNAEVIIAVRGEMPSNLRRTVEQVNREGVAARVIHDGRERGNEPVAGIQAESVTPWASPRGCGQARHFGITKSAADVVIICDGHMTFEPGWIKRIMWHHRRHKNHLTCCRMQSLNQYATKMDCAPEGGAWLARKTQETWGNYWSLAGKWQSPPMVQGETPCVYGACYAMRRAWYNAIGQPLRILEAWGCDEELLSLATWCAGGKVVLLPEIVGHIFAAKHTGRDNIADQTDLIWSNRYAMLDALPMRDETRKELGDWMRKTRRLHARKVENTAERTNAINEVRATLEKGKDTIDTLTDKGLVREPTEMEARMFLRDSMRGKADQARTVEPVPVAKVIPPRPPPGDVAQVVVRSHEVCKTCGAVDSFKKIEGARDFGCFQQANARCCMCGHKARIRLV
jgi:hypothetical protein